MDVAEQIASGLAATGEVDGSQFLTFLLAGEEY
ncbi:hypothetical protein MNBD_GAMMA20-1430, partial [hydrothermal vent metagenome]